MRNKIPEKNKKYKKKKLRNKLVAKNVVRSHYVVLK